jgi:Putative O-antigen polymerase
MITKSLEEPIWLLTVAMSEHGRKLEKCLAKAADAAEKTRAYSLLERYLSKAETIELKSGLVTGDFFAPWNFLALFSLLYLFMALVSPIPILDPRTWAISAFIFLGSMALLFGTAKTVAKRFEALTSREIDYGKPASAMLFIGSLAIVLNFLYIGIPALEPAARLHFHNTFYQFFFMVFLTGLALTATKTAKLSRLLMLAAYAGALTFLTSFRTDFLLSVGPVLLAGTYTGVLSARKLGALLLMLLPVSMLITLLLLFSGDSGSTLNNLVAGRAGFTMYTMAAAYENIGLGGIAHGGLLLNSFTQFFTHRIMIGGFAAEYSSLLPRYFTSTFAGPLLIDGGIIEVAAMALFAGAVLGALYGLRQNKAFAAMYSIAMWYTFIWIETGPIQFYFLAMHMLFGYLALRQTSR